MFAPPVLGVCRVGGVCGPRLGRKECPLPPSIRPASERTTEPGRPVTLTRCDYVAEWANILTALMSTSSASSRITALNDTRSF